MVNKKTIALAGAGVIGLYAISKAGDKSESDGWSGGMSGGSDEGDSPEVFKKDVVQDAKPEYVFNFPDMPDVKKGMNTREIDQWFEQTYNTKEYDVLKPSKTSSEPYGTPQGYGKHGHYKKEGSSRTHLSSKTKARNLQMSQVKKDSGYVKKADTQKAMDSVYKKGGPKTGWF